MCVSDIPALLKFRKRILRTDMGAGTSFGAAFLSSSEFIIYHLESCSVLHIPAPPPLCSDDSVARLEKRFSFGRGSSERITISFQVPELRVTADGSAMLALISRAQPHQTRTSTPREMQPLQIWVWNRSELAVDGAWLQHADDFFTDGMDVRVQMLSSALVGNGAHILTLSVVERASPLRGEGSTCRFHVHDLWLSLDVRRMAACALSATKSEAPAQLGKSLLTRHMAELDVPRRCGAWHASMISDEQRRWISCWDGYGGECALVLNLEHGTVLALGILDSGLLHFGIVQALHHSFGCAVDAAWTHDGLLLFLVNARAELLALSRCGSPIAFTTNGSSTPLLIAPSALSAHPTVKADRGGHVSRQLSLRAHGTLNRLLLCDGLAATVVFVGDISYASCASQIVQSTASSGSESILGLGGGGMLSERWRLAWLLLQHIPTPMHEADFQAVAQQLLSNLPLLAEPSHVWSDVLCGWHNALSVVRQTNTSTIDSVLNLGMHVLNVLLREGHYYAATHMLARLDATVLPLLTAAHSRFGAFDSVVDSPRAIRGAVLRYERQHSVAAARITDASAAFRPVGRLAAPTCPRLWHILGTNAKAKPVQIPPHSDPHGDTDGQWTRTVAHVARAHVRRCSLGSEGGAKVRAVLTRFDVDASEGLEWPYGTSGYSGYSSYTKAGWQDPAVGRRRALDRTSRTQPKRRCAERSACCCKRGT
jgi:hypothetical protein